MSLSQLNKNELIDKVIESEQKTRDSEKLREEQKGEYIETIINLQSRCMTLRHQRARAEEGVMALQHVVSGLNIVDEVASRSSAFDIRTSGVMKRLLRLFGPGTSIHVCSVCGDIAKADSGLSGERICKKCMKESDWPWPGETVYLENNDGEMVE